MIFVSYSHQDETWRKRFETMSKPLSRAESMRFWSDRDIKAGEWEKQIETAIQGAVAAVLLVSDNFLASDYIIEKELPYLLRAHKARGLMILGLSRTLRYQALPADHTVPGDDAGEPGTDVEDEPVGVEADDAARVRND